MFLKQPKIRRFDYSPRFYQPESKDEDDNHKIRFKRLTDRKPAPKRSFWGMLILIVIIALLIRYLASFVKADKEPFKFEGIKIETIE